MTATYKEARVRSFYHASYVDARSCRDRSTPKDARPRAFRSRRDLALESRRISLARRQAAALAGNSLTRSALTAWMISGFMSWLLVVGLCGLAIRAVGVSHARRTKDVTMDICGRFARAGCEADQ